MRKIRLGQLVRRDAPNKKHLDQLINFFETICTDFDQLFDALLLVMTSCYCQGDTLLMPVNEKTSKCWFVASGAVIAYYYDAKGNLRAHTIYAEGEMAILPHCFMNNNVSNCNLMAVSGSH